MKPRTIFERRVERLSEALPPLSSADAEILKGRAFKAQIVYNGGKRYWCDKCGYHWEEQGNTFSLVYQKGTTTCPCCGAKAKVVLSKARKWVRDCHVDLVDVFEGLQLVRTFHVTKRAAVGSQEFSWEFQELCQSWHREDGERAVMCRRRLMNSWCSDGFNYLYPMTIKAWNKNDFNYCFGVNGTLTKKVLPVLRRNGYDGRYHGLAPAWLFHLLLSNPKAETLAKAKYWDFFDDHSIYALDKYWSSLKICLRNGYKPKDARMWQDLVRMLKEDEKDTHNAYYVCPENLKEAHDRVMRRLDRKRDMRRYKEDLLRSRAEEEQFRAMKGKFFGIVIVDGDITISVLDSVEKYVEEGHAMHHCVYACGYHMDEDSLVLSAKDVEGNRLATIEMSLEDYKVKQCRGVDNSIPPHYERIVHAVEGHKMDFLRAAS